MSNFFMHIFNMSVTYLQSAAKIQWKLLEELISQNMHYRPLFARCSHQKMAKLKTLQVCPNIFSASNFFMHICNMSVTYLQSVEKIQWKFLRGVDFTKYALSNIIYYVQLSENG